MRPSQAAWRHASERVSRLVFHAVFLACAALAFAGEKEQPKAPAAPSAAKQTVDPKAAPAAKPTQESDSKALDKVLAQMDTAAANFRTAQANFVWAQYNKVVDSTDEQKGTIYYRRQGKEIQMMADLSEPLKSVLFSGGKVQVYEPKIKQVTTYEAGKNRDAIESFLVLGFGGGGHDMAKSFDVKYLGTETVDGVNATKLELVPKSERVRNIFGQIYLWIDMTKGISVQQKFCESSGDYRLAKYRDIQLPQKLPDNVFKLKTTSDTKFLNAPKS